MSERGSLSSVERELLGKLGLIVEHGRQDALTRQLRELMLLMNSPDHDSSDFMACSGRILDYLQNSRGQLSALDDSANLEDLLNASRHQWASRHPGNKPQKALKKSSISRSLVDGEGISQKGVTRINYPISPETYRLLQDAQFLYRLTNMPEAVPHSHQSILTLMKSSSTTDGKTQLYENKDGAEEFVQRTYWDQMKEVFSRDDPKAHIDKLKTLYVHLSKATSRFFPPVHPLYSLFKYPLAPTTRPLQTAILNIQLLIIGLRQRCAPVRDEALTAIGETLAVTSSSAIVNASQAIIQVSKLMHDDLSNYILQNASEQDAKVWVRTQARAKEREVVLHLCGTQEKLEQAWKDYLHVQSPIVSKTLLARRLLETVSASTPAVFVPTDFHFGGLPDQNIVPPQLMLSVDLLIRVQDLLQAVVIVASLHNLVPVRSDCSKAFISRIWSLVELAVLEPDGQPGTQLKLVNLQDEVLEAYRSSHTTHPASQPTMSEDILKAAVSRTLRTEDPVFRLLQNRLISALEVELVQSRSTDVVAPFIVRTGREQGVGHEPPASRTERAEVTRVRIKGFEDTVLDEPISRLLQHIYQILEWVAFCWSDFVSKA